VFPVESSLMPALVRDPIYQQLNQALQDLACGGEFGAGAQFLTERQVAERFGVSRATANKALSGLVAEGLLEFRKGIGTFLRGASLGYDLRSLVSFTEKARTAGKEPSTRVLEFRRLRPSEVEAPARERLAAGAKDTVIFMRRLRLADGVPVILERRFVPARLCPSLRREAAADSLYEFFSVSCGLRILSADEVIRAINIPAADARLLGVTEGSAGLLVSCVGYLSDRVPLWWEQTLYRGDAYEFHNRLGARDLPRPAVGALLSTTPG
jgi:GntR family transcriptional regulator